MFYLFISISVCLVYLNLMRFCLRRVYHVLHKKLGSIKKKKRITRKVISSLLSKPTP